MSSLRWACGAVVVALLAGWRIGRWWWRHLHAPAYRGWQPPSGLVTRAGPLSVRLLGDAGPVVVLLHGMVGSGREWGAGWDALARRRRLVVPDLLGFGRSQAAGPFGTAEHVAALGSCLRELGVAGEPLLLVGHSLGGALALEFAADRLRQGLPVTGVAAYCPPLFDGAAEADRTLSTSDWVNRAMTAPGPLPRVACRAICGGHWWGKAIYVAMNPLYPVALVVDAVYHCFESYRESLDALIRTDSWRSAIADCQSADVPVLLAGGDRDHVVALGRHETLVGAGVSAATRPNGGHDLPIADPQWCLQRLYEVFGE